MKKLKRVIGLPVMYVGETWESYLVRCFSVEPGRTLAGENSSRELAGMFGCSNSVVHAARKVVGIVPRIVESKFKVISGAPALESGETQVSYLTRYFRTTAGGLLAENISAVVLADLFGCGKRTIREARRRAGEK